MSLHPSGLASRGGISIRLVVGAEGIVLGLVDLGSVGGRKKDADSSVTGCNERTAWQSNNKLTAKSSPQSTDSSHHFPLLRPASRRRPLPVPSGLQGGQGTRTQGTLAGLADWLAAAVTKSQKGPTHSTGLLASSLLDSDHGSCRQPDNTHQLCNGAEQRAGGLPTSLCPGRVSPHFGVADKAIRDTRGRPGRKQPSSRRRRSGLMNAWPLLRAFVDGGQQRDYDGEIRASKCES
ncbi:hypothetical protein THAOC_25350 [Thalassiosira oceanica]|uniref:Uncharacterized protein n=1 Tax=Thalassiosira oceanica TaxID=159749 RepID=K0RMK4_THAOC|nr:hypothetical protein THAOC_25350 [Thalassiosira oceanica]|eukprot:EJK54973.1 hypothetical protein THAOC_25350 [Thalassiosira oceanica]